MAETILLFFTYYPFYKMTMYKIDRYVFFPSVIIFLYYCCRIFFLFNDSILKSVYPMVFGFFSLLYLLTVGQKSLPFIFFLFLGTLLWFNTLFGGYAEHLFRPILPISYLLIVLLLINSNISVKSIQIPFYIFIVLYIFLVFVLLRDPNTIFVRTSRNTVSSILLEMGVLLQITKFRKIGTVDIFSSVLVFLLSVSASGRSGIVSSGLFLSLIILDKQTKSKNKIIFFIVVLSCIFCFIFLFRDVLAIFLKYLTAKGLDYGEDPRSILLKDYLGVMKNNPEYFFLGVNQFDVNLRFFHHLNDNWHNSFLTLHSHYTLFGFIFICLLYCSSIVFGLSKSKIYLGFLLVLSLRSFTDTIAFPGSMDIVLFYLFYLILSRDRKNICC